MVACAQVHASLGVFVRRGSARGGGDERLPLHRRLHLPLLRGDRGIRLLVAVQVRGISLHVTVTAACLRAETSGVG